MKIEDIRLGKDELDDAMHNPPTTIYCEFLTPEQEARHIANTATDKAIKKIIEHLQPDKRFNFNATCYDCMESIKRLSKGVTGCQPK